MRCASTGPRRIGPFIQRCNQSVRWNSQLLGSGPRIDATWIETKHADRGLPAPKRNMRIAMILREWKPLLTSRIRLLWYFVVTAHHFAVDTPNYERQLSILTGSLRQHHLGSEHGILSACRLSYHPSPLVDVSRSYGSRRMKGEEILHSLIECPFIFLTSKQHKLNSVVQTLYTILLPSGSLITASHPISNPNISYPSPQPQSRS